MVNTVSFSFFLLTFILLGGIPITVFFIKPIKASTKPIIRSPSSITHSMTVDWLLTIINFLPEISWCSRASGLVAMPPRLPDSVSCSLPWTQPFDVPRAFCFRIGSPWSLSDLRHRSPSEAEIIRKLHWSADWSAIGCFLVGWVKRNGCLSGSV